MTKITLLPFHIIYRLLWVGFVVMWYVYILRSSSVPQGKAAVVFILALISGIGFFIRDATRHTKLATLPIFGAIMPVVVASELIILVLLSMMLGEYHARGTQFTDVLYAGIGIKVFLGIGVVIFPHK